MKERFPSDEDLAAFDAALREARIGGGTQTPRLHARIADLEAQVAMRDERLQQQADAAHLQALYVAALENAANSLTAERDEVKRKHDATITKLFAAIQSRARLVRLVKALREHYDHARHLHDPQGEMFPNLHRRVLRRRAAEAMEQKTRSSLT